MIADQFIKTTNCHFPLTPVPTSDERVIPVVVSGDVSAKGSVKAMNRSTSHKKASGHGEITHKKNSAKIYANTQDRSHQLPNKSQQKRKHRIIIVDDSHARGSASNLKHNLNDGFGLTEFARPGAHIYTLTSTIKEDTKI